MVVSVNVRDPNDAQVGQEFLKFRKTVSANQLAADAFSAIQQQPSPFKEVAVNAAKVPVLSMRSKAGDCNREGESGVSLGAGRERGGLFWRKLLPLMEWLRRCRKM